jgi:uncharacterized protein YndB with AHSA1/START domain
MLLSAEVRWFWQGSRPDLYEWFAASSPKPGGGEGRVDTYLFDAAQAELGIKSRGLKPGLELKALVSYRAPLRLGSLTATTQIWTKVSTTVLSLAGLPSVVTNKQRWLRKYDTGGSIIREIPLGKDEKPATGEPLPDDGCNVELTEVWVEDPSRVWTTLGFEAFGSLERIEASLAAAVHRLGSKPLPDVGPGSELSYPQWLATQAVAAMGSTRIRRHVNAPRATVYRALLDARAVATWMVPTGMTSHVHAFDPREGGSFRISLTYDEPTGTGKTTAHTDTYHGHFVQLVPDQQVVEVVEFETTDPALLGEMTITITLADAEGGTDVLAVHDRLPPGLSAADNEDGWRSSLAKLAALVEAG